MKFKIYAVKEETVQAKADLFKNRQVGKRDWTREDAENYEVIDGNPRWLFASADYEKAKEFFENRKSRCSSDYESSYSCRLFVFDRLELATMVFDSDDVSQDEKVEQLGKPDFFDDWEYDEEFEVFVAEPTHKIYDAEV